MKIKQSANCRDRSKAGKHKLKLQFLITNTFKTIRKNRKMAEQASRSTIRTTDIASTSGVDAEEQEDVGPIPIGKLEVFFYVKFCIFNQFN